MVKTQAQDNDDSTPLSLSRIKPFKYTYQKEIVLYAFYKNLTYFSTECTYAPGASRGEVRSLIKTLEKIDPTVILRIIKSGESFQTNQDPLITVTVPCNNCGHPTSSKDKVCNGCNFVSRLSQIE